MTARAYLQKRAYFMSLRAQYENLGDELINGLLARRLAQMGHLFIDASTVPAHFRAAVTDMLSTTARPTWLDRRSDVLRALVRAGFAGHSPTVFLAAGDYTGAGRPQNWLPLVALQRLVPGMRIAQVGASLSSLSPSQAWFYRLAGKSAKWLTVRDPLSADLLRNVLPEVTIVPDLAFALPFTPPRPHRRHAVLTIRASDDPSIRTRAYTLANQLRDAGLDILVTWQVARDETICRQLAAETGAQIFQPAGERLNLDEATRLYADAKVVVSNRLHALLLAASTGASPVGVLPGMDRKIAGVFRDAQLQDLVSHAQNTDATALAAAMSPGSADRLSAAFDRNAMRLEASFSALGAR